MTQIKCYLPNEVVRINTTYSEDSFLHFEVSDSLSITSFIVLDGLSHSYMPLSYLYFILSNKVLRARVLLTLMAQLNHIFLAKVLKSPVIRNILILKLCIRCCSLCPHSSLHVFIIFSQSYYNCLSTSMCSLEERTRSSPFSNLQHLSQYTTE